MAKGNKFQKKNDAVPQKKGAGVQKMNKFDNKKGVKANESFEKRQNLKTPQQKKENVLAGTKKKEQENVKPQAQNKMNGSVKAELKKNKQTNVKKNEKETKKPIEKQEKESVQSTKLAPGKKGKFEIKAQKFNPKINLLHEKRGKKVEESTDEEFSDEELEFEDMEGEDEFEFEDLEDEELEIDEEESDANGVSQANIKKGNKEVEAEAQKANKKDKAEVKTQKRPAAESLHPVLKKLRTEDPSVLAEEERRRNERDSRGLILILDGKQKLVSDSMIRSLHPDIVNVTRTGKAAFVHFVSEIAAEKAFSPIQKMRLLKKPVKVDYLGIKSKRPHKEINHNQGIFEPTKLYITGLPADISKEKIQVIFPKAKQMFLNYKKRVVYLEFENETDAKEGFEKGRNLKIGGTFVVVTFKRHIVKEGEDKIEPTKTEKTQVKAKNIELKKKEDITKKAKSVQELETESDLEDEEDVEGEELDFEDLEFAEEEEDEDDE